jgi:hypothetical protein
MNVHLRDGFPHLLGSVVELRVGHPEAAQRAPDEAEVQIDQRAQPRVVLGLLDRHRLHADSRGVLASPQRFDHGK